MALSALDDLSQQPTGQQVASVLDLALEPWELLRGWLADEAGVDAWEWGSSGKKYGWGLRAKAGKRTVAYLIPQHGSFLVGLVLGDRAVEKARRADLVASVVEVITNAKRYGEGTGFKLPVATPSDLEDIRTLIRIKLAVS
ncbi:MAG: DUF3788 domain-containing protein [Acidobacteria bacterium]|jgi:hypothetical protein|nr:DUF3788 domain-containing protein [Acidobacteriota bacterium]